MLKLVLNNDVEVQITGYNRYINIQESENVSSANFNFSSIVGSDALTSLAKTTISDIKIYSDDNLVYHLENQNAKLTNINENVYEGVGVSVDARIEFNSMNE